MVVVGSLFTLPISFFALGFDGYTTHQEEIKTGKEEPKYLGNREWSSVDIYESVLIKKYSFKLFFHRYINGRYQTNWLGIIALFNITVSSVGFFLFKDK